MVMKQKEKRDCNAFRLLAQFIDTKLLATYCYC